MTTHNVKAKLNREFDKFLNSIENKEIKLLVQKNAIITGGAIASMYLNEPVNDYDIYFKSKDDALKIAQYYIDVFKKKCDELVTTKKNELSEQQLNISCNIGIDDGIKIVVPSSGIITYDNFEEYYYFETLSDDKDNLVTENKISKFMMVTENSVIKGKQEQNAYAPLCISQNAITLSDNIQLIFRFTGDASKIHENFDFVHSKNYWVAESGELYLHADALESLITKQLKYDGSKYPLATLFRVRKFIERGFTIHAGELVKMAFQINDLDLNSVEVLMDQLTGVDMAYLNELINEIKKEFEKDEKFEVTSSYICELVDKIFD